MLDPILRDAIDEIVRGAMLQNWPFYGLVAAIALLSTVIGNAISSYARTRGQTLATKADFEEILRQLQASTKATEDIKASVQHSDWLSREWKVVRRTKLEELLDSAYAAELWLKAYRDRWIFQTTGELGPDPIDKARRLCALYFPELRVTVAALRVTHSAAFVCIVEARQELTAAGKDLSARQKVLDSMIEAWGTHRHAVVGAISDLETQAAELMAAIRDV